MTAVRVVCAVVAWASVLAWGAAAVTVSADLMVAAMGVGAVAALGWGFCKSLQPRPQYRGRRPAEQMTADIYEELPYRRPARAPWWDTDVMGAPE